MSATPKTGFFAVFRQQFLEVDGEGLDSAFPAMVEAKSVETMTQVEKVRSVDQWQLEVQGEALEAVEKTYGIWQSVKLSKHALVYSMLISPSSRAPAYNILVLAAYLCVATYVSATGGFL